MVAPIVLFVYNRPWHTQKTIESLLENTLASKSDLYVFSDGPKRGSDVQPITELRNFLKTVKGFNSITVSEKEQNQGIARSVVQGVTEIVNKYGKVIVMEDDLISSPYFLQFMIDGLSFYENTPQVFSLGGYTHPPSLLKMPENYPHEMYFSYRPVSCGWSTWADRWNKADWQVKDFSTFKNDPLRQKAFNRGGEDMSGMLIEAMEGKIDSWAIRWSYTHFVHDGLAVYPVNSYIDNIGHDGTGINSYRTSKYENNLAKAVPKMNFLSEVKIDEAMAESFRQVYKRSLLKKITRTIRKTIFQ